MASTLTKSEISALQSMQFEISPNLVDILRRIYGFPLKFESSGFIRDFLTSAAASYVPRDAFRALGLRRGNWNVSFTYVRKRKSPSLGMMDVLHSRSKKRALKGYDRGEEEAVKVEGLQKLFNEIFGEENFDVGSPLGDDQNFVGMDEFDCSTVVLDQTYNLSVPHHNLSCFESINMSYAKEEGTGASDPYVTNSMFPHKKGVDLGYEHTSLDVGLDANIIKEQTVQSLTVIEPYFSSFLDPSLQVDHTMSEDCNILSLDLGFIADIPEEPVPEKLNAIELDFNTYLMDEVHDHIGLHQLDHNFQRASSYLACSNQQVVEAISERKLYSKDDKLIISQLETSETPACSRSTYFNGKEASMLTFEFGVVDKNSAAIGPTLMDEPIDVAEDKERTFSELSIKNSIASVGLQNLIGPNIASNSTSSGKQQDRDFEVGLIVKQKVKNNGRVSMPSKENRVDAFTKATKSSSDQKMMPNFESFIIQEEEGSGGYGTVYKAQRKEDGKIFAVKCPHANAHSHHVYNELKMLERFGGRNFVIKYECSFKNGDSDCFVLEHVEHDRPEILKKEIDMFELQWYGFCMFKALASLHKQGVVHRDVKPGNFLFSRKVNKGYLIDFNLASDLHQKFCRSSKRKMPSASLHPNSLPEIKSTSTIHSRKFIDRRHLDNAKKEAADESRKVLASKSSKKKAHKGDIGGGFPIVDRSKHGSQTADGSGVTSTKDQTSNKTPVNWLNQPIPCKGRKELINYVQNAMHSPQNLKPVSNGPSSQRKRIAAPMTKTDTSLLILTPMPLHSGGNAVAGAGMLKTRASGKVKREGPCVGTKGFRAPEVLFKSFHQGCKIDVWSAGVTMLFLMIGRAPFGGDPEQNIKEIAKLRGSEDLWEVAKLHNCESSFPVDLLVVESLKSMELSDWCAKNTRRPEFFELIPKLLFDLVDKCLSVNPRRRYSAEEALMHKFFAPCHESIRKHRLLRKVNTLDPSSSNS